MSTDLIEIEEDDDDTLLSNDAVSSTALEFSCSPLLKYNPTDEVAWQMSSSGEKENVSGGNRLSVERQKMKKKKKGFHLRKSLAWNHAFFTDEGVLDPTELSMLSGGLGAPGGEMLSVIDEGSESFSGGMEGDLHDLQAGNDNLLKELPSSSIKKGQKTTRNVVSASVPGSCGKEKDLSFASAVKRKVLSAYDINRSAPKRGGGSSHSVPSSSLKRPSNLNTTTAVRKEPRVSKLSTVKPDQLVNSAANRSSKTSANPPKCNQKAFPAIPKKNVAKAIFTNTKGSSSNVIPGPAVKPILKSSIRPARNVVKPVSKASTSVQKLTVKATKIYVKSESAVSVSALTPGGHNGSTRGISVSLDSDMRQAPPQAAKPTGLRMPSPSLRFFDQAKPGNSQGLLQKSTQLVRPTESGVCASKVCLKPPLPPRKISAVLDSGSSIVPTINLNSLEKLKSNLEVNNLQKVHTNSPCKSQIIDEKTDEHHVNDVGPQLPDVAKGAEPCKVENKDVNDVGPQLPDVAKGAEPCKVENKDVNLKNSEFLFHGTCEQLKKDDSKEAFTCYLLERTELVFAETDNPKSTCHVNVSTEVKGLPEPKTIDCDEICLDTQSIDMNNSFNNLSERMLEQAEEHAKLTETGSHGVPSLSSLNSSTLKVCGLSENESMIHSQICEDTQCIDMDICSDKSTSEVYDDLPGEIHGMNKQFDEQAKLMETNSREVSPISIMNCPLLPVNYDILFETAHHEELSRCKSLEVADCSVQAKVCTSSKPVMCGEDNLVNGSGKNTLSTAAADKPLLMIMDDLHEKESSEDEFPNFCDVEDGNCGVSDRDGDSCQGAQGVMLRDPDSCESELKKMNNHLVTTDPLSGMYTEYECSNTCVVTKEAKGLPIGDQQANNTSCVKFVSSEETNSDKDELKSPSTIGSVLLFEKDDGVDTIGEVSQHVESAPTVNDVNQVVQIIKHQLLEGSSLGLERTDGDNSLITSKPVLVGNSSYEESFLCEKEIDSSVCSAGSEMGNEIQQFLEQDKMVITDCFHDTEQKNQNEDAHDGLLVDDARSIEDHLKAGNLIISESIAGGATESVVPRVFCHVQRTEEASQLAVKETRMENSQGQLSIEDSLKAENVILSETIAAGATGPVVPHVFGQVQRTEEASQLSVKETPMEISQGQLSHESLLADRCNTNISSSGEKTDYLMVPDNAHEQPEERPVLENPDHIIGQIYEESLGSSSDNYLRPRKISTVEDVASGGTSNICSTELETLNICSLQTPAMEGSGLEIEQRTESMNDMMISGSHEVESSVENVDIIMVGEYEADGRHRSYEPLEFESPMNNDCHVPSAENSIADKVDNDSSSTEMMQGLEAYLLDNKTSAVEDETHVVEESMHQSDLQYEMKDATGDKNVTASSKESLNEKRNAPVIKPPPNVEPFSDEWLAAFEAAGEEILTMKSGAVQNSPPDKSQPEPSPWSPVKRKNNQGIGPYDCTKYTNAGIPPSTSS